MADWNTTKSEDGNGVWVLDLTWDDATWILTASFIIFTMQTGFGALESGCVSLKNESNIMMKNVVDIVFGGLSYWLFGFSISFGTGKGSNPIFGVGEYAVDSEYEIMGPVFASFMFQLSFATTATTIVSGTMAERCNFKSYCLFSLTNTIVYCFPARWIWGPQGFLSDMGAVDIAGSGAVHLLGGVSGYVAAWMLGPRLGRYDNGTDPLPLGSPANCIVGLFVLWWGWLAFNSGSTFGVSGDKWRYAARAAVTTTLASMGGGVVGIIYGLLRPTKTIAVMDIVNPVLGSLVSVTAGCALYHTFDAFVIGIIGGIVIILTANIADYTRVDDPVGATSVHGFGGFWGLIAVGLFGEKDPNGEFSELSGIFRGGNLDLLLAQLAASAVIIVWSACITCTLLWIINKIIPIRMEPDEELLGADFVEHLVRKPKIGLSRTISVFKSRASLINIDANFVGAQNPAHDAVIQAVDELNCGRWRKLKSTTMALGAIGISLGRKISNAVNKIESRQGSVFNIKEHLGSPTPSQPKNSIRPIYNTDFRRDYTFT